MPRCDINYCIISALPCCLTVDNYLIYISHYLSSFVSFATAAIPAGIPTRYGKISLHQDGALAPAPNNAVLIDIAVTLTQVAKTAITLKNLGVVAFHREITCLIQRFIDLSLAWLEMLYLVSRHSSALRLRLFPLTCL